MEVQLIGCSGKERRILRIGPRPTPLDELYPKNVELAGNTQLVLNGEGDALLLGPIS